MVSNWRSAGILDASWIRYGRSRIYKIKKYREHYYEKLIVFIQELFQHLFIQLKLIGFGAVDGYHNLVSMILLDHVQFIWLVVSLH